jgi:predicted Zn-dependent protease
MVITEAESMAAASRAYADMIEDASAHGDLNPDLRSAERVRDIAFRIIPHAAAYRPGLADWRWEANVFRSDVANAFCMPGGKIGLNSGLLARLQPTDDELAQVLGHEIAHALSDHSREKISTATTSTYVVNAIGLTRYMNTVSTTLLKNVADVAVNLPNSRVAESEADQVGVLIAAKAGYDPKAAVSLWEKVRALQGEQTSSFLSTHPLPAERIAFLQSEATRLRPIYMAAVELKNQNRLPKFEPRPDAVAGQDAHSKRKLAEDESR